MPLLAAQKRACLCIQQVSHVCAGAENIDQKKRHNCSGKTPSPSETVKDACSAEATSFYLKTPNAVTMLPEALKAKAVGEQLGSSTPVEPAAKPAAQTPQTGGGASAGNDVAAALTTSTKVEEMREKQEKRQGEGGNDQTASQVTLAGVSQSPLVLLNSKV